MHRNVLHVCFTVLTNTELAGVSIRLLVFHTVVRNSMQPGPRPSSAKQGLNGVCFSLAVSKADLQRKWLCLQFWGPPACNGAALLSVAKVAAEIAAASPQMFCALTARVGQVSRATKLTQLCQGRPYQSSDKCAARGWGLPETPDADLNPRSCSCSESMTGSSPYLALHKV